jgi:hypothetical protein
MLYHDDVLLFLGYVFGFPLLLVPLAALAHWSERRNERKRSSNSHDKQIG